MSYRCANDLFGYCTEEPKWGKPPFELGEGKWLGGGSCKLNPKTCGKYKFLSELVISKGLPQSEYRKSKSGRIIKKKDDKTTNHRSP